MRTMMGPLVCELIRCVSACVSVCECERVGAHVLQDAWHMRLPIVCAQVCVCARVCESTTVSLGGALRGLH